MKVIKLIDLKSISKTDIVVYPTDTIYGLGCYALNANLVSRLRALKQRDIKPFSIIVSKEWIRDNCVVNDFVEEYLRKLPGSYTIILELKNKDSIASNVNNGSFFVGVRIPDHPIVKFLPIPFITTSVNISGQPHINSIDDIPKDMKNKIDLIIDVGHLDNKPSTVVDLTKDKAVVLRK